MVEEIAEITEYAEGEIQIQTLYGRNRQSELVCVSPLRHREKLEKSNEKNQ